jgi:hypothetical protein
LVCDQVRPPRPITSSQFDTLVLSRTYFHLPQSNDRKAISLFCNVARYNRTLTRLSAVNIDSSLVSCLVGLGDAIRVNGFNNIRHLILSGNELGTRGFGNICSALDSLPHELLTLCIGRCGLYSPSIVQLFDVFLRLVFLFLCSTYLFKPHTTSLLLRNPNMALAIEHFDVSNNRVDMEGSSAFQNWLMSTANKQKSAIRKLNLGTFLSTSFFAAFDVVSSPVLP